MPSKRYQKAKEVVDGKKAYPLKEAVGVLAKFPKAKFNETIDLAFRLGVDPKQSDQMVAARYPCRTAAAKLSVCSCSPRVARPPMQPGPPVRNMSALKT